MPNLTCSFCKLDFVVPEYRRLTAKFCSRSCLAKAKIPATEIARLAAITGKKAPNNAGLTKKCEHCMVEFSVSPSRARSKKFCSQACYAKAQRVNMPHRYVRITVDGVRKLEHRHIVEHSIGRPLKTDEHVDHINRIKNDNRLENLRVLSSSIHGRVSSHQRGTTSSFSCHCDFCLQLAKQ